LAVPRQLRIQYEGNLSLVELGVIGVRRFFAMIWIADAHDDDGKRFVVRAEEKLSAALRD